MFKHPLRLCEGHVKSRNSGGVHQVKNSNVNLFDGFLHIKRLDEHVFFLCRYDMFIIFSPLQKKNDFFHPGKSENSPRYVEIFAQHLCFVGDLSTCTVAEFIVVAGASDEALHWVLATL